MVCHYIWGIKIPEIIKIQPDSGSKMRHNVSFFLKYHVSLLLLIIYNIVTYVFSLNVIKNKFKLFKIACITFTNTYYFVLFVALWFSYTR